MSDAFDLLVVGAGSGGIRAARMAARAGVRVAVVEASALGGTCVNVGCIPKKLYGYASAFADSFRDAMGYGWDAVAPRLDWERLKANRRTEIQRLNDVYQRLLEEAGVTLIRGCVDQVWPGRVHVEGRELRAERILLATGGQAVVPLIPGDGRVLLSDQMFDLPSLPSHLVVIGGGYIACEFASIFRGFGCAVTQLIRADRPLRGFDREVAECFAREARQRGVDLRTRVQVASIASCGDRQMVALTEGCGLEADAVLLATGRRPRSSGLGLVQAGVRLDERGAVVVDDGYQTSVPGIYAIGDLIDRRALTPVAIAEAMIAVTRMYGGAAGPLDYDSVPSAVFAAPEVAVVGLDEAAAQGLHDRINVYRSDFRPLLHTLSGNPGRVFIKLIEAADTGRVLGVHVVGPGAAEIVQGFAVAMKAGATKRHFDETLGIHPSVAEELVVLR